MAHRLAGGYYVHFAILDVAAGAADRTKLVNWNVTRDLVRKDGTPHVFSFDHYLRKGFNDPTTRADLDRVWTVASLLTLAQALQERKLGLQKDGPKDVPLLQLVRHLRNAVAHDNRFDIRNPTELAKCPANNFDAGVKSPAGTTFEVIASDQGKPVLFDFMGPADFADLFMSVEVYLFTLAVDSP